MRLQKTDLAKKELLPGVRTLGQRERSLLLMADGMNIGSLSSLFQGEGEKLVMQLLRSGYLSEVKPVKVTNSTSDVPPPSLPDTRKLTQNKSDFTPSAPLSVDQFDGKRSLATTRMFLFDMCERMFAKRSPDQAAFFRASLRESRDRATMLAVAKDILLEIESVAGYERADSIRERIAMLLPPEEALQ